MHSVIQTVGVNLSLLLLWLILHMSSVTEDKDSVALASISPSITCTAWIPAFIISPLRNCNACLQSFS